jgi:hypothetical protein
MRAKKGPAREGLDRILKPVVIIPWCANMAWLVRGARAWETRSRTLCLASLFPGSDMSGVFRRRFEIISHLQAGQVIKIAAGPEHGCLALASSADSAVG